MRPLRILYLGRLSGTSLDRARAYGRLGHTVRHIDPRSLLHASVWVDRMAWRLGGGLFAGAVSSALSTALGSARFDLCHVDGGEWVNARVVSTLRRYADAIVNYNHDDPLGDRDGRFFRAYRQAVAAYDLLVVVRKENVAEAKQLGARRVLHVFRSADEITHAPRDGGAALADWSSEVLFIGTWMPERGPFLLELKRRGVPLSLRGSSWDKATEWRELQGCWRGPAIYGNDYARAIQSAKITLGLLSKGNRDLHTTRSTEVPLLGSLFCAERTHEHLAMYDDGAEAVFWSDAAECARQCLDLLADEPRRSRIATQGQLRARRNGHLNEVVMQRVLDTLGLAAGSTALRAECVSCSQP